MTSFNWDGSVSVVTGAATGIGLSMAESFAARGSRVVVADIEFDAARAAAAAINDGGGTAMPFQVDVSSADTVAALADHVFAQWGRVDLLCNNAGVTMRPFRAVWEASEDDFRWIMEVNYFGVVHGLRSFLPRMRAQTGRKQIVNTSSMATLSVVPGHGMYSASKAAVDALSECLREELIDFGDDFGVTVLHPGSVVTRISSSERLRPATTRSSSREVPEYPYRRQRSIPNVPLEASTVGDMVASAIDADARYCLTHEADLSELREKVDERQLARFPAQ